MIEEFKALGINPQGKSQAKSGPLLGKSFLFTGTLSAFSRPDAEAKVTELGAKILTQVSKNLTYLVVGENPGSKVEKAQKINQKNDVIKILSEEEFLKLINFAGGEGV
jgi:DNA ligase (NAD+)